jgi:nitroreductase
MDFSNRDPVSGVDPLFVERWSPRAFSTQPLEPGQLERLLDAARWSPSCFNEQPWRFYLSSEDTFADYLALLVEANQAWARHASHIGFMVGRSRFRRNGKPNELSDFDCGAAWMGLCLQARVEGLYTHGMAGIDKAGIAQYLNLDPDQDKVIMGFAIGRMGDPDNLDASLREREVPSPRLPLDDIWLDGKD